MIVDGLLLKSDWLTWERRHELGRTLAMQTATALKQRPCSGDRVTNHNPTTFQLFNVVRLNCHGQIAARSSTSACKEPLALTFQRMRPS